MSRVGWVKLYGQTLDSDFWMDNDMPFDFRSAFIHVLISANWTQGVFRKGGHTATVERGQLLTSIRKLGATFRWDKDKVYRWLKYMADTDMITSESLGFGTLLTVVNYEKYQGQADTVTHTPTHTVTHTVTPQYKNKEQRIKKTNSAPAENPSGDHPEPPVGSREWYALHNEDDEG